MLDPSPRLDEYVALFTKHGDMGTAYLREHFPRYLATKQRLLLNWDRVRQNCVLDVGAHWLHQAVLYAIDGFKVTALDFPATLDLSSVRALAQAQGIRLLPNADLEYPAALGSIPDDSFDLVLFTEVIEHLAFNPIAMWREIYRVMRPGARIVITTPNYYALRSRARQWLRSLRLLGGGVAAEQILSIRTLGHHWKEYSLRELIKYFQSLSPDFACVDAAYVEEYLPTFLDKPGGRIVQWLEHAIPFLRPDLYLEIELARKDKGILVEPHW